MGRIGHLALIPFTVPLEHAEEVVDPDDVCERVVRDLDAQRLRRRLRECLPPLERRCVALRWGLDGNDPLPVRQIAARIGMSRQGVEKALARAYDRLRDELPEVA